MNRRVLLALTISAGMALLVSAIFYQIAVREPGGEQVQVREVIVAAKDLVVGASIEPSDLKTEPWPENRVPEGAVTEIAEAVGRVPINRILANEPLSLRRLADRGSGLGLAPKVPPGMRAMSVRVNDVIGVSGFVLPEAKVDVLVTGTPRGSAADGQMTRTILSNVRVISAGENMEPDASGKAQRVAVVTLLVSPKQAELLTLAGTQGRLQLVLRNSRDQELATSKGVREPEIFVVDMQQPEKRPARPIARPVVRTVRPPPPPPIEVEVYRGNQRSVQSFTPRSEGGTRE